jgi:hypothetical protein
MKLVKENWFTYTQYIDLGYRIVKSNTCIYEDDEDPNMAHIKFPMGDIETELKNNYIIRELIPNIATLTFEEIKSRLKPLLEFVENNCKYLGDVYDKDIDYLIGRYAMLKIVVLTDENGNYLGHIYQNISEDDEYASFIGIRSSLLNIAKRLYEMKYVSNISYYLLDSSINMLKIIEREKLGARLEHPIGSMIAISVKYGFDENYQFDLKWKAKINIGAYSLLFFLSK